MGRIRVACVGAGYWGKNLVRVFDALPEVELRWICDKSEKIRDGMRGQYPDVRISDDYDQVLADDELDAVVLAVPAVDHFEASRKALEAGKNVYVEKPLTLNTRDAVRLAELVGQNGKILMVGHLFEYHPAVEWLKDFISRGELGDILYLYAQRVNLGIVRKDENAMWSLAPHDISLILYLLEQEPDSVSARGECYLQKGIEDVVFVNLHFGDGKMAQMQLSWLDPHKIRRLTLVGSKKMAVFDDVETTEKIKIYDKGVKGSSYESYGDAITLHFGDIVIPHINMVEPLKLECQHFVECVANGRTPRSDVEDGLRVIRVLEAAQESLEGNGTPVRISKD